MASSARQMQQALAGRAMNVTISTVASTRFDMEARGLNEVVRASVHYYNDEAEIERFCATLRTILASMMEAKGWFTVTDMIRRTMPG